MSYAYLAGRYAAFSMLGLNKTAALNAKTMLPPMLKGIETAIPKGILQAKSTAPVSKAVLAESPWHQYMALTGEGKGLAESGVSEAFRGQLASQGVGQLGVVNSLAPTVRAPAPRSLLPTVPPLKRGS